MSDVLQDRAENEIQSLRRALDEQTRRCLEAQEQLQRAEAGFEDFISIAAHNLREPLRDIAAFSQLLAENYADRLEPEAAGFLNRMLEGAQRMQSLLADMVDYWSASNGGPQASPVDMEAVLCQALLSTDALIAERGALITHDPLPHVYGEFATLAKVLSQLIQNAIAYCDTPPPRIHISSRREDRGWALSVRDNGPGIASPFQARVFEPFKRLHGRECPGNGLGLAFCKKAIEAMGGHMWLESAPETGSTFYFTTPAAE